MSSSSQKFFSRKKMDYYSSIIDSKIRKTHDHFLDGANKAYNSIRQLDSKSVDFIDNKTSKNRQKFVRASTIVTTLLQTTRPQIELIIGVIILISSGALLLDAGSGYIVYRLASTGLVIVTALSSYITYKPYAKDVLL